MDALTRRADFNYAILAESQTNDGELLQLLETSTNLQLERIRYPRENVHVYCEVSTGAARPYITQQFRRHMFNLVHELSHPGVRATSKLLTDRYIWKDIKKNCRQWTQQCVNCQQSKVQKHSKPPIGVYPLPKTRLQHIQMDIMGPLPSSRGFLY